MGERWTAPWFGAMLAASSCTIVLAATPARAGDRPDAPSAEAVFLQGRSAMEAGRFEEACSKFAESERLDRAAGTLMNLATCEERIDRLASAWQHWKEAIDLLEAADDRVTFARQRVDDLEKRLPRLTLTVATSAGTPVHVSRDGVDLGAASWGEPLPVDAGAHEIVVTAPGRLPSRFKVVLAEAEQRRVDVQPGPPAPLRASSSRGAELRTIGWTMLGVGAASAAAAVVSGVLAIGDKNTADANCPDRRCTNQKGLDAVSEGKVLVGVNTAAIALAAVGVGVGTYFVVTNPSRPAAAVVGASAGPSSAFVSLSGTF